MQTSASNSGGVNQLSSQHSPTHIHDQLSYIAQKVERMAADKRRRDSESDSDSDKHGQQHSARCPRKLSHGVEMQACTLNGTMVKQGETAQVVNYAKQEAWETEISECEFYTIKVHDG